MSVTRIRIVTNPDGSLSLHARPGKDREGLSPDEQALSERFDRLAGVYRSGLLSTEEIGEAVSAVQNELDRRQTEHQARAAVRGPGGVPGRPPGDRAAHG